MRIVFFGSDAVAVPALRKLYEQAWCTIECVVTQPAQPVGRKQLLQPTRIAQLATELGLPIHTNHEQLPVADVAVVVDYGRIIPLDIQQLFKHGIINIHPSLLPRWRGPSPIQSALLHGDATTGVTIMKIDSGVDTGPILVQSTYPIPVEATATTLESNLAELGAQLLVDVLPRYIAGELLPQPQSGLGITHSRLLKRSDGLLQSDSPAAVIWNQYRGLQPWPGVYAELDGKRIKIVEAHWDTNHMVIDRVQLEGKQAVAFAEFERGYPSLAKQISAAISR